MGGPKMETMMTTNHATKKSYVFFYKLNRVTRGKFLPAGPKGEWTFTTLLYNHITRCILKFNVKICLYLTLWQFSSKSLRLSSVTAFCLHRNILLSTLFLKNVQSVSFLQSLNYLWSHKSTAGRLHLKCDATRAETRFCLSAKRMSPFKSLGVSVQLTTAAEVCASVVVMLDTPCSEVVWRVLVTHSICQFPLHFPSRASPCAITFQLDSTAAEVPLHVHSCRTEKRTTAPTSTLRALRVVIERKPRTYFTP